MRHLTTLNVQCIMYNFYYHQCYRKVISVDNPQCFFCYATAPRALMRASSQMTLYSDHIQSYTLSSIVEPFICYFCAPRIPPRNVKVCHSKPCISKALGPGEAQPANLCSQN